MRLLNARTFKFQEFFGDSIPPYAILSHTWGEEEIIYQDIQHAGSLFDKSGQLDLSKNPGLFRKKGFPKLFGTCAQAVKDGLEWIWDDTCCIDKTNIPEVSESINSMYKWYSVAHVCYVYLQDVTRCNPYAIGLTPEGKPTHGEWGGLEKEAFFDQFSNSKWFTRGWTLQELLAPPHMEFYNRDWVEIGTKQSLKDWLSTITGISTTYLLGGVDSFREANVGEKMSWASNRVTTKEEDMAYCLLGIFEITMPTLYGEGRRAFQRLQEEILRSTDDPTILFGAKHVTDKGWGFGGMLSSSPADFPSKLHIGRYQYSQTSYGGPKREGRLDEIEWSQIVPEKNEVVKLDRSMELTNNGLKTWFFVDTYPSDEKHAAYGRVAHLDTMCCYTTRGGNRRRVVLEITPLRTSRYVRGVDMAVAGSAERADERPPPRAGNRRPLWTAASASLRSIPVGNFPDRGERGVWLQPWTVPDSSSGGGSAGSKKRVGGGAWQLAVQKPPGFELEWYSGFLGQHAHHPEANSSSSGNNNNNSQKGTAVSAAVASRGGGILLSTADGRGPRQWKLRRDAADLAPATVSAAELSGGGAVVDDPNVRGTRHEQIRLQKQGKLDDETRAVARGTMFRRGEEEIYEDSIMTVAVVRYVLPSPSGSGERFNYASVVVSVGVANVRDETLWCAVSALEPRRSSSSSSSSAAHSSSSSRSRISSAFSRSSGSNRSSVPPANTTTTSMREDMRAAYDAWQLQPQDPSDLNDRVRVQVSATRALSVACKRGGTDRDTVVLAASLEKWPPTSAAAPTAPSRKEVAMRAAGMTEDGRPRRRDLAMPPERLSPATQWMRGWGEEVENPAPQEDFA